jgi:threonylcarbamoyladenosine tRNA methylthiotransferase MtaB
MKKVSFYTLGCKLNQAETAILAEQFEQQGYQLVPFDVPADVCVINTCTVTGKSDYRCRQMVRQAQKVSPNARIAVVGCYAQLDPEKIQAINGVDFILGSDRKFELVKLLDAVRPEHQPLMMRANHDSVASPLPGKFWDHTRAFLKIQDGCDSSCSYCTVPLARGRSRSDSLEHILEQATILAARGHREIVLTGVHIGRYGHDLRPPQNLLVLLEKLEGNDQLQRIRLSSLEPLEIDAEFIQWVAQSTKVCHHFHIPLQSGDDEILRKMNRSYDAAYYARLIDILIAAIPNCGLGTDIIVGFPGETEAQFQNTCRLVEQLPFTYLHVFSFSPRPGTKAFHLKDRVDPVEVKRRSQWLRELARSKKMRFHQGLVGQKLRVLWETKDHGGWMVGLADNYARVRAPMNPSLLNSLGTVKIVRAEKDFVQGIIE